MKRVTGIGGIFFKAEHPEALLAWYEKHLGIQLATNMPGSVFESAGQTVWSVFPKDTKYFSPSTAPFMVNYRVENLLELVKVLREEGVEVLDTIEDPEYGKFAWVLDPEGNRIELWEPPV
ncbi:glyoxalase [Tumebacillus algifaecis]|uniref:Glyoxalase n=1 Tax=Tumebacillus algifaecis TaxID=1214604 RepID=A0A223D1M1_9BACL|nr:VOC family protein [Tumebacillus algifaecis]ASS75355.1 glyoxalase [Tumebacillus algifaecis]